MSHAATTVLPKCGCGRQDTGLMAQHGVRCGLLLPPKLTLKLHVHTTAVVAFVADGHANTKVGQRLANVIEAPLGSPM